MSRSKLTQINNVEKEVLIESKAEVVEMTLNTQSAITSGLLIQRLTELYADPIVATVRETVSNALDAVTEAHSGVRPEVRITTPTSLKPALVIRDNGVGMTYDDLKDIYSKYGASSKADDMEQIGAYGLGAKAPLSYGSEFTVASVKDGQKTIIIVAKEEVTNYIKIIDSGLTDEPSGTTVTIPVSSSDIYDFETNVNRYIENPLDKDVDLYVNGEKAGEGNYSLITDSLVIFEGNEKITARMWVDKSETPALLEHIDEDTLKRSLKFLIGGWVYDSPTKNAERYYSKSDQSFIIELKAGIVGFNSARDAILGNERFKDLEDLVVEYIRSDEFMMIAVNAINGLSEEDFKNTLSNLISRRGDLIKIEDGKGRFTEGQSRNWGGSTKFNKIMHPVSFEMLTHNETGFNMNTLFENLPHPAYLTSIVSETKNTYNKTVSNSIMVNGLSNYSQFRHSNIRDINIKIDSIFDEKSDSASLQEFMIFMAKHAYSKKSQEIEQNRFTIITDIDSENLSQLKTSRKSILRMRNEGKESTEYNSYLVYTSATKKEIKKMVKTADFDKLDLSIEDATKTLENIKEFRKSRKTVKRARSTELSTRLIRHVEGSYGKYVSTSEIDSSAKNLIMLLSNDTPFDRDDVRLTSIWYCNKHNLDLSDINTYTSTGNHKASDIELLKELGEVMRYEKSDAAGRSKIYMEEVHENVTGRNALLKNEPELERKSFVRLLTSVLDSNPINVFNKIEDRFEEVNKIATVSNHKEMKLNKDLMETIKTTTSESFPKSDRYYVNWSLCGPVLLDLLDNLTDPQRDLVQGLAVLTGNAGLINGETSRKYNHNYRTELGMNVEEVEKLYEADSSLPATYVKMKKTQVEAYIEYVRDIIELMSTVNFG